MSACCSPPTTRAIWKPYASRVIIINHGQIVYEDKVSNLKRKFLTSKLVEVRYAEEVPANFSLDGVEILKVGHYGVKLRFDTAKTAGGKSALSPHRCWQRRGHHHLRPAAGGSDREDLSDPGYIASTRRPRRALDLLQFIY